MANIMDSRDSISGSLAECFIIFKDNRYNFMQAINLEASIEKTKWRFPSWARRGREINPPGGAVPVPPPSTTIPAYSGSSYIDMQRQEKIFTLIFK